MAELINCAVERARFMVRRDGAIGVVQTVLRWIVGFVWLTEDHVWCMLDLAGARPAPQLSAGITLIRAEAAPRDWLGQLSNVPASVAEARIQRGHDLWLALRDERMLFSMWVFRGTTPTIAAPDGEILLPDGVVCFEDVQTVADMRGRGIAPAAFAAVADSLAEAHVEQVVAKIAVQNEASIRAFEKAGFQQVSVMHFRRHGRRRRTWFDRRHGTLAGVFADRLVPAFQVSAIGRC